MHDSNWFSRGFVVVSCRPPMMIKRGVVRGVVGRVVRGMVGGMVGGVVRGMVGGLRG